MTDDQIEKCKQFEIRLKALRGKIKGLKTDHVSSNALRTAAESLGKDWFSEILPIVNSNGTDATLLTGYSEQFRRLIKISNPNNRKTSYQDVLKSVTVKFHDELILPLHTTSKVQVESELSKLLAGIQDSSQSEYLKEAVDCAAHNFLRAAAVLGWCAAIHQIFRAIDKIGFAKFNATAVSMSSQQTGRFKKFNQKNMNVSSVSELGEVFDTIILWVLEGMGILDINQHTRLRSCFELRCQCAHPGEAPITEYNLLSFFSDLNEIVFKNPKLTV